MTEDEIFTWAEMFSDLDDPVAALSEEMLLERLRSDDYYDRRAATVLLKHFGTGRSVEPLKEMALDKKRDMQISAAFSLKEVAGTEAAEFFATLLDNREFREKWAASICLCRTGGPEHEGTLFNRIKQISSRKRSVADLRLDGKESTETLEYIDYVRRNQLSLDQLEALMSRRRDWFSAEEKDRIGQRAKGVQPRVGVCERRERTPTLGWRANRSHPA